MCIRDRSTSCEGVDLVVMNCTEFKVLMRDIGKLITNLQNANPMMLMYYVLNRDALQVFEEVATTLSPCEIIPILPLLGVRELATEKIRSLQLDYTVDEFKRVLRESFKTQSRAGLGLTQYDPATFAQLRLVLQITKAVLLGGKQSMMNYNSLYRTQFDNNGNMKRLLQGFEVEQKEAFFLDDYIRFMEQGPDVRFSKNAALNSIAVGERMGFNVGIENVEPGFDYVRYVDINRRNTRTSRLQTTYSQSYLPYH
eukprot:TRINITY_DN7820_c0_g1_i6.p2 TRINITY_DN7820_c0_g1~~TRINITY_DN7820_c0_g1_i6.p2  ORF type:complete len:254 (-),score=63.80 TRINITY_DN7820_c0_g1_i6:837-1598(-)